MEPERWERTHEKGTRKSETKGFHTDIESLFATYQENWKSVYERFHIVSHGEEAINKKKSLMIENKGHLESEIQNTKAKNVFEDGSERTFMTLQ